MKVKIQKHVIDLRFVTAISEITTGYSAVGQIEWYNIHLLGSERPIHCTVHLANSDLAMFREFHGKLVSKWIKLKTNESSSEYSGELPKAEFAFIDTDLDDYAEIAKQKKEQSDKYQLCIDQLICPECGGDLVNQIRPHGINKNCLSCKKAF